MGPLPITENTTKISFLKNPIIPFLQFFLILLIFFISLQAGNFLFDSNTLPQLYMLLGILTALPFLTYGFSRKGHTLHIYFLALEIFLYLLLILVFAREWFIIPLTVANFGLSILKMDRSSGFSWNHKKILIFIVLSFLMYLLGSLMQFIIQPPTAPVTLVSLKNVFIYPGQVFPFLFDFGANLYGNAVTVTMSPFTFIVFTFVSALVAENYEGFFAVLRRNGGGTFKSLIYGVTAALSCQCEACISLLPAMVFILVTVSMIPLIIESLVLLYLSNYLIRMYLRGTMPVVFRNISASYRNVQIYFASFLILILTPLELAGIYIGWLSSPIFFFGMAMLNTLAGYVLIRAVSGFIKLKENMPLSVLFIAVGTLISLSWYYPSMTFYAFNNGLIFSIMAISGLAAGILFGLAHSSLRRGYVVPEAVSLIYGIFVIVIFYLSIDYRLILWPEFSYTQTAIFEIISWAVMLPVMWIFTQIAIYAAPDLKLTFSARMGNLQETEAS